MRNAVPDSFSASIGDLKGIPKHEQAPLVRGIVRHEDERLARADAERGQAERVAEAKAAWARDFRKRNRAGGEAARASLMSGLQPLTVAAGGTSLPAMLAASAPALMQAGRDLREMGVDVAGDPQAAFNLAMLAVGAMTGARGGALRSMRGEYLPNGLVQGTFGELLEAGPAGAKAAQPRGIRPKAARYMSQRARKDANEAWAAVAERIMTRAREARAAELVRKRTVLDGISAEARKAAERPVRQELPPYSTFERGDAASVRVARNAVRVEVPAADAEALAARAERFTDPTSAAVKFVDRQINEVQQAPQQGRMSHLGDVFKESFGGRRVKALKKAVDRAEGRLAGFEKVVAAKAEKGAVDPNSEAVAAARSRLEAKVADARAGLTKAQEGVDAAKARIKDYSAPRDAEAALASAERGSWNPWAKHSRWDNGLTSWDVRLGDMGWKGKTALWSGLGIGVAGVVVQHLNAEAEKQDWIAEMDRQHAAEAERDNFYSSYFAKDGGASPAALAALNDDNAFRDYHNRGFNAVVSLYNAQNPLTPKARAEAREDAHRDLKQVAERLRAVDPNRYRYRVNRMSGLGRSLPDLDATLNAMDAAVGTVPQPKGTR